MYIISGDNYKTVILNSCEDDKFTLFCIRFIFTKESNYLEIKNNLFKAETNRYLIAVLVQRINFEKNQINNNILIIWIGSE